MATYNDLYCYTTSTATTTTLYNTTANILYNHAWSQASVVYRAPVYPALPTAKWDPVAEGAAIPENDMAWLRRRVREISWVPA